MKHSKIKLGAPQNCYIPNEDKSIPIRLGSSDISLNFGKRYEPMEFIDGFVSKLLPSFDKIEICNLGSGPMDSKMKFDKYNLHNLDQLIDGCDIVNSLAVMKANSFDIITSSRLFEHISISDMSEFIYLCYSALKPNGLLVIAVPDFKHMSTLINDVGKNDDWFQKYNILNSIIYHQITDDNNVLLDSHKSVWTKDIMKHLLEYENNFKLELSATPMTISNQTCYLVGVGRKTS